MIPGVVATVDWAAATGPAVTVTPAVWVSAVPFTVAETVFPSATVELSVPVATPLPFVAPAGCVRVFPVPDAANTTAAPPIRLPFASFAVTVIVLLVPPAAMLAGAAATVDWLDETAPGVTVTAAVAVNAVPFTVAEIVFPSGTVELSVPVATPLPSVVAAGCVSVFPLPVAASTTVAPPIRLPFPSFAVTVTVVVGPPAAMLAGAAVTVDTDPEAAPGVTVITTVCVTASPFAVAETVFPSATVELNVPVATPLPSVTAGGCVSVFPLPVAASTTVAPLTGLPDPSLAVTVIVVPAPPAVMLAGAAATVDCVGDTALAVTVTAAVWVSAVPFTVAETVFPSGTVELNVPVATPLAFVWPAGCVTVFPLPVAASTTVAKLTGLPYPSFAVTVIVATPLPGAIVAGAAATVDTVADTAPAVTVTGAVAVSVVPFTVAETVFPSATVELTVPVATPLPSVAAAGCVTVFPLPVAASTTAAPLIRLPLPSFAVTVIVAGPPPAAMLAGAAATVDAVADSAPAVTVTAAVCVTAVPPAVADTVFGSATVELIVPVATPLPFVVPVGCVTVFPVPVAANITVAPPPALPLASLAVTVIVVVAPPALMLAGAAATVDADADTAPAVTVTAAVAVRAVPLTVADTVFPSA